ncbi:hypothetical protein [Botrimarina sp.]|uniref:hypothetical protein n=1 Tax=Botrimarina sp. TaxID=2795802 RepID=UPI0032EE75E6
MTLAGCAAGLLAVGGCGGMPATLSGQVTLNGEPVETGGDVRGTVLLQPKESNGAPASGSIDDQGRYQVLTGNQRGLTPGDYAVTVSLVKTIPPQQEGAMPWAERLIPPRYTSPATSGLEVTVEPGGNTFDISLERRTPGNNR